MYKIKMKMYAMAQFVLGIVYMVVKKETIVNMIWDIGAKRQELYYKNNPNWLDEI